jgi:hypothetical protein
MSSDSESESESNPTTTETETRISEAATAVVLIGNGIFFKPAKEAISATTTKLEELSTCLDGKAEPSSIGTFHLIMKASSVATLFDADAMSKFATLMIAGGDLVVHIMENPGEEDVDTVKMALVLANFRIQGVQNGEGGAQLLVAKLVQ